MAYIPLRKAVEFLDLHPNTLRKYADEGKIKSIKNPAGQRLYDVESYIRDTVVATTVCYCRVSSTKQRDDLDRQVVYMQSVYPSLPSQPKDVSEKNVMNVRTPGSKATTLP